jgi:transcriptional regulator of acetoin/glycerol metabolism
MAADTTTDIRAELVKLGKRREKLDKDSDHLADEVTKALRRAYGKIPVAEAARLLNIHRTTVYRVYSPHE